MRKLLILLVAAAVVAGCKSPRSPRNVAMESVTGTWTTRSDAPDAPPSAGAELVWRIELEQVDAGKLRGRGSVRGDRAASDFTLKGVRDESKINLELHPGGETYRYVGSVMDAGTITGEMHMPGDTVPVTLTREP